MEVAGDAGGIEDRSRLGGAADLLGIELGDPPVVFAWRRGGDVGELAGVGRPVELIDVEVGGCDVGDFARGGAGDGDALNLDPIFADDAGPGLHGVEGSGGTGGVFDKKEGNGAAVRRPGGGLDLALEMGELVGLTRFAGPDDDLRLAARCRVRAGAGGEKGEGGAVRGPGRLPGRAFGCAGGDGDGAVRRVGVIDVGEMKFSAAAARAEGPGEQGAVGGEGKVSRVASLFDLREDGGDAGVGIFEGGHRGGVAALAERGEGGCGGEGGHGEGEGDPHGGGWVESAPEGKHFASLAWCGGCRSDLSRPFSGSWSERRWQKVDVCALS